mmetsp:Transcript_28676/g.66478  ORF Transcript_28676/g.66478 Transcript_28676/m.66478 type:complete len:216 (-) Transcript_28676:8-655(-)
MLSCVNVATCASSLSRALISSSRCAIRLLTVFSWFTLRPAPCSTRWLRFAISTLRLWIVSLARCSFSCEASTIFHALSISFLRLAMVAWSSLDRLRAVWTLVALDTISAFSSRHFLIKRFSLSCDFLSARWSFSYSSRKCSKDLSPMSSWRTSWKSFSRASNALDSMSLRAVSSTGFSLNAPAPEFGWLVIAAKLQLHLHSSAHGPTHRSRHKRA